MKRGISLIAVLLCWSQSFAQEDDSEQPIPVLEFTRYSGELNVPDPVAISLDPQGRAFVTQTQRRKAQDLDIRQYEEWVPDDVGFQSVEEKRDFYRRQLAPDSGAPPTLRRFQDLNQDGTLDFRDLMVLSEKIHVVEDTDADGTADKISLFADQFQTEVTGIAAGVLWHDGAVYATIAPDVWKLRDTNGDGKADQREVIATGFGLHIAYGGHDMHGLTVGPDGKIYWSIGDKGISVVTKEGRKFHYPNQGGVMRCNPDGSEFEVFAHGLRNVQELAFDEFGNLFGVDNDSDQPGERERVVYIVEGMDAGWRSNYQYRGAAYNPWMAENLWKPWSDDQAAYIIPPLAHSLDGPAGFTYNPGTALSPNYRGYFFLTGAPTGEQRAFRLEPRGASFAVKNEHEIGRGVPLVGINFGPDGALYGVDWGGGYPLNQKGAIWKIDAPAENRSPERESTKQLLQSGFSDLPGPALRSLLSHADQRVRLGAQFELVKREAVAPMVEIVGAPGEERLSRIHALWGLGQLAGRTEESAIVEILEQVLQDADYEIRAQALKTIRRLPQFDGERLVPLLKDPHPRVQFHAAMTAQAHPSAAMRNALVEFASKLQPEETYLRHAAAYGLSGAASAEQLAQLHRHRSASVRLVAILALRQQINASADSLQHNQPYLAKFLDDSQVRIVVEAAAAIYESVAHDPVSEISTNPEIEALAQLLPDIDYQAAPLARRVIGAAFLRGGTSEAIGVARYAARPDVPRVLRMDALHALGEWNLPPLLDRVDGRRRVYGSRMQIARNAAGAAERETRTFSPSRAEFQTLSSVLVRLLRDSDGGIRAAALQAIRSLEIPLSGEGMQELAAVVGDPDTSSELRQEALATLAKRSYPQLDQVIRTAMAADDVSLRIQALELLRDDPAAATEAAAEVLSQSTELKQRQHAIELLGELGTPAADARLAAELEKLREDTIAPGVELELLAAVRMRSQKNHELKTALSAYLKEREPADESDPVVGWFDVRQGGDPEVGRSIFMTNITAQCVRCHRIGAEGSNVGPDLNGIAKKRNSDHLLRAIVAPSADIDPEYRTQTLLLASGKIVQGLPVREDEEVTVIADSQGNEIVVSKEEIEQSVERETSIMPDMTDVLSRRQIRDLLAFLKTLDGNRSSEDR